MPNGCSHGAAGAASSQQAAVQLGFLERKLNLRQQKKKKELLYMEMGCIVKHS